MSIQRKVVIILHGMAIASYCHRPSCVIMLLTELGMVMARLGGELSLQIRNRAAASPAGALK